MNKLAILIAVLGWSVWAFANKLVAQHSPPMLIQAVNYSLGFLCMPIFWYLIKRDPAPITTQGLLWAIGGSIFGVIAYASFTYALKSGEAGTTIALSTTYPALTFLMGVIFLGETITLPKIAGILAVLIGIALIST